MMNFRLAGEKIAAGDVDGDALFPLSAEHVRFFREVIARAQKRRREEVSTRYARVRTPPRCKEYRF